MSLALAIRRTTTNGPSTVDKKFAGGDRYVGQWEKGLVSVWSVLYMLIICSNGSYKHSMAEHRQ